MFAAMAMDRYPETIFVPRTGDRFIRSGGVIFANGVCPYPRAATVTSRTFGLGSTFSDAIVGDLNSSS